VGKCPATDCAACAQNAEGRIARMKYEFDAEIKRLEGKIQWAVFYFPEAKEETKANRIKKLIADLEEAI
jgi:hypothetical protein